MRAPDKPEPAAADILIADMVKKLGGSDAIEQDVRNSIAVLAVIDEPQWGNQAQNLDYMKTLQGSIRKLQTMLRAPPANTTYLMLFAPEEGETIEVMIQEAQARQSELTTMLEDLHVRCDKNIAAKPGVHGSFGYRERQAAIEARLLWERHGKHPTLAETFIEFAENLFCAAWRNEKPQDMKRACGDALRSPIKTDAQII
jgi:hypothetical protein